MWTIPLRSEKTGWDTEKKGIKISKEEAEGLRGERGENTKFGKD